MVKQREIEADRAGKRQGKGREKRVEERQGKREGTSNEGRESDKRVKRE